MNHSSNNVKYNGIYRCPDNIHNFKIRVRLREIKDTDDTSASEMEDEVVTFQWQQKVYGRHEREFYRDEKNCVTDLEKKYHNHLAETIEDDGVLFSYTDEDGFIADDECTIKMQTKTTELQKQMNNLQLQDSDVTARCSEYDLKQLLLTSLKNHHIKDNFEIMHIMADLGEFVENTWLKCEYVLCSLKYNKQKKVLLITPDFNCFEPYFFQIHGDITRNYLFYIEDVSDRPPDGVITKENDILTKIAVQQKKLLAPKVTSIFELPPKNKLKIFLFLEILSGQNFEYDNIYVKYFIDLGSDWACETPSALQGTTQSSKSQNGDDLVHFGFVFDVVLDYNIQNLENKCVPNSPYVYFEVISKDSWNRFRTEGLTYQALPIARPGINNYNLHCFRLRPRGFTSDMRRYFIGDCSNYHDVSWISKPKTHEAATINKYGVDTVSTGQLNVKLSVMHQSQAFIDDPKEDVHSDRERLIFERLNSSSLVKSVQQVLEAFKKVRKQVIEARKNV